MPSTTTILTRFFLALLVAFSVPRFQATVERLKLEQAITHLNQTLRAARERAIAEGRTLIWTWEDDAHQSHLEALVQGVPQPLDERAGMRAKLPDAVNVEILSNNHEVDCRCVHFFPDGTSDPTTTITFKQHQQQTYTITIHETTGSACLVAGTAPC